MLKIVGHRGARGLAPENTLAGIRKALEHHVDEIEIDARVTKDGVAVVHHDQFLKDAAGNWFNIRTHTYQELLKHKPDMPTLESVIRAIKRKVPLQIEVKWGEATGPVADVLHAFLRKGWSPDDFLIGSKKQATLRAMHQALPEVPKVIIEPFSGLRGTLRARQIGTKRLSMNRLWLWGGFIRIMSRRGYRIYAYTLDNPRLAKRWRRHGLAGVITDCPDRYE